MVVRGFKEKKTKSKIRGVEAFDEVTVAGFGVHYGTVCARRGECYRTIEVKRIESEGTL